jgi:hypothetical protein
LLLSVDPSIGMPGIPGMSAIPAIEPCIAPSSLGPHAYPLPIIDMVRRAH